MNTRFARAHFPADKLHYTLLFCFFKWFCFCLFSHRGTQLNIGLLHKPWLVQQPDML